MGKAPGIALAGSGTVSMGVTREWVLDNLELAGMTLAAMRLHRVGPAGIKGYWPEILHDDFIDMPKGLATRAALPGSREISHMDLVLRWVGLIPPDKAHLRRAVNLRLIVDPISGRSLVSWTKIGKILRCNRLTAKSWHEQGIGLITRGLKITPTLAENQLRPFEK